MGVTTVASDLAGSAGPSFCMQVFLPELAVLQADPAASVRKFLPEFLQACPPAALQPESLLLVLQCLQGLLQDSVPAVVKAAVMASSTVFRTALAVVVGQVCAAVLAVSPATTHAPAPLLKHTAYDHRAMWSWR